MPRGFDAASNRRRRIRRPFLLSRFNGLNDDSNNEALDDRDLRTCENVFNERANLMRSRFGYHRDPFGAALNSGEDITGIWDFRSRRDGENNPIFAAGNTIYREDPAGDPSTATAITGGTAFSSGQDNVLTAASFKDQLILAGDTAVPQVINFDATSKADISGWFADARQPKFVHSQFNYLFFAGYDLGATARTDTYNEMTVNYSGLNDEGTWIEENVIDKIGGLSSYGDEYVTALFRHRDFMMVGTNRRIYPVTYTGDNYQRFVIQRPINIGVAHQRAVISINGEFTFVMDPEGEIHQIRDAVVAFGDVGVRSVSRKIRNYVNNMNKSRVQYAHGTFWEERGWCVWSVSQGAAIGANNELIILDVNDFPLTDPRPEDARWYRWKNVAANAMNIMRRDGDGTLDESDEIQNESEPDVTGGQYLMFGSQTGWVKRFTPVISYDHDDSGNQDSIQSKLQTKFFDFGLLDVQKSVSEAHWTMEPASDDPGPNATWVYDFGQIQSRTVQVDRSANAQSGDLLGTTFVLDTSTLGGVESISRSKDYFTNAGTEASLRLEQNVSGAIAWKLQSVTAVVELRGEVPEV
ncbi:hypothetical protein [uncultured Mediterranean phage]|nr:hypothetical protein [uncultured Mediterranean phage]